MGTSITFSVSYHKIHERNNLKAQERWHIPLNPALGRQKLADLSSSRLL